MKISSPNNKLDVLSKKQISLNVHEKEIGLFITQFVSSVGVEMFLPQ